MRAPTGKEMAGTGGKKWKLRKFIAILLSPD
jgi:hypothetical protein